MELLIISGLSGAGKSRAMGIMEDLDYYCVDNMPVALIGRFAELCMATRGRYERVALATDARQRGSFGAFWAALDELTALGCAYKILFLEASVETIVKRYKETRRRHPLAPEGGSIEDAVRREIKLMADMRARADYVIDTSSTTIGMLQAEIYRLFIGESSERKLQVNVLSFGFKYGIPAEADLVFDVRFLPNPYYEADLREKTGLEAEVADYVLNSDSSRGFMERLTSLVDYLLPLYVEEGKYSLTIAVGCTGGRHRSVAVAQALARHIESPQRSVLRVDRDVERG